MPITVIAAVPNALMVHPSLPFNTVPEFIQYLKTNPDKLTYASQGSGSTAHLTAELFKLKTGLKLLHVPYKGDAPAITDLLAGHVDIMFGNIGATMQYVKTDKLKLIALTTPKRIKSFPNIPTINEYVPGMIATTWFAMVAPPKTPQSIVTKLSTAISTILKTPEMQKKLAEIGAEPIGDSPEETAKWIKEDTERWKEVIFAGKISI
jgi:tripartite-type tricarboxylate transporter receptor subunit TctC